MTMDLKKEIKGPDAIQKFLLNLLDFFVKNQKLISLILTPVVLIVLAGLGWRQWSIHQAEKRRSALAAIVAGYDQETEAVEKQREELTKNVDKLKSNEKKSDADSKKLVELEAQLKSFDRDHEKSIHTASLPKLKEFFESHSGAAEGWFAGLLYAGALTAQKNFAEAKTVLETIRQKSLDSKLYQMNARFSLIGVYEELNQLDDALKECEFLASYVPEDLQPQVLIAKGKLYLLKKSQEEAKQTFQTIITKHGKSPEAQKAKTYLAVLD